MSRVTKGGLGIWGVNQAKKHYLAEPPLSDPVPGRQMTMEVTFAVADQQG